MIKLFKIIIYNLSKTLVNPAQLQAQSNPNLSLAEHKQLYFHYLKIDSRDESSRATNKMEMLKNSLAETIFVWKHIKEVSNKKGT